MRPRIINMLYNIFIQDYDKKRVMKRVSHQILTINIISLMTLTVIPICSNIILII